MGCFKTLTFAEAPPVGDTPLHSAIFLPSTGTIIGTMENFLVEFNATTGAMIRAVKAISPLLGPMWIGLVNGNPWVSCRFDAADGYQSNPMQGHPLKDIFPIDSSTLEVSGQGLVSSSGGAFLGTSSTSYRGPNFFIGVGTRIYFLYDTGGSQTINYIDTLNPIGDKVLNEGLGAYWSEQFATNGTRLYLPSPYNWEVSTYDMVITDYDFCATFGPPWVEADARFPVATEWVSGSVNKAFCVCASKYLLRINTYFYLDGTELFDSIDLEALIVASGITDIKPMRLRYNSADKNLYIPVQNKDGIIIYDTVGGTAIWKGGFDSPVDVVFTGTKMFAVQSGLTGLKEIV